MVYCRYQIFMQRWTQIFKALANDKRINIIRLLPRASEKHVSDISAEVRLSIQGTSRHLRLLNNLYVLNEIGKNGHVYYSFNKAMPDDMHQAIDLFIE